MGRKKTKRSKGRMKVRNHIVHRHAKVRNHIVHRNRTPGDLLHQPASEARLQYGGLVRASGRFRGWMGSPDAKRADGRIPYESTERAERHGRVRCQALRGIEITDRGSIKIAGLGEINIVGGARQRRDATVREVSIQETTGQATKRSEGSNQNREFIVLMTLNVEQSAYAPAIARERPQNEPIAERNGPETGRSADDAECAGAERQDRWKRRKGRRQKQGSTHAAHSNRDGRPKGRSRNKDRSREWDGERY